MADAVLHLATELSKGLLIPFGNEDGVIAEASLPPAFLDDGATHDTFEQLGLFTY